MTVFPSGGGGTFIYLKVEQQFGGGVEKGGEYINLKEIIEHFPIVFIVLVSFQVNRTSMVNLGILNLEYFS